jgi:hypothetical protein
MTVAEIDRLPIVLFIQSFWRQISPLADVSKVPRRPMATKVPAP